MRIREDTNTENKFLVTTWRPRQTWNSAEFQGRLVAMEKHICWELFLFCDFSGTVEWEDLV